MRLAAGPWLARPVLLSPVGMGKTSKHRWRSLAAASALLAVLAAGCGSSAYARRTAEDRHLSARVGDSLAASPGLSGVNVEARSHWGVVALLGEVPDEALRQEAERAATAVPGVVRVNNLILVVKGASKAEGRAPAAGALFIARAD